MTTSTELAGTGTYARPSGKASLDSVQPVYWDTPAGGWFAQQYVAAKRPDHRLGEHTAKDEKAIAAFAADFTAKTLRAGFAGSGEVEYTHKATGATFVVRSTPNGRTFWGTDHQVLVR